LSTAQLLQCLRHVFPRAVDVVLGAQLVRELGMMLATSDGDGIEAHLRGVLHPEMAESPHAQNRYRIRRTCPAVPDRVKGRDPGAEERTQLGTAERIRHPRQRHLGGGYVVSVAPVISDARHPQVLARHVVATPARLALTAVAPIPAEPNALPNLPLGHG